MSTVLGNGKSIENSVLVSIYYIILMPSITDQNAEPFPLDPWPDNYLHDDEHDQQRGPHAVSYIQLTRSSPRL